MRVRPTPDPGSAPERAVEAAARAVGLPLDPGPEVYASRWRSAGLVEAVDRGPDRPQAASPRSTRGATRA